MNLKLDTYGELISEWLITGITKNISPKAPIKKIVLGAMDEDIVFFVIGVTTSEDTYEIAEDQPYMEGIVSNVCEFDDDSEEYCHFIPWAAQNGMNFEKLRELQECKDDKKLFQKLYGKNRKEYHDLYESFMADRETFEHLYISLVNYEFYQRLNAVIPELKEKGYSFSDNLELGYAHHDDEEVWEEEDALDEVKSNLTKFSEEQQKSLIESTYLSAGRIAEIWR